MLFKVALTWFYLVFRTREGYRQELDQYRRMRRSV
jgi:hypothetical protein